MIAYVRKNFFKFFNIVGLTEQLMSYFGVVYVGIVDFSCKDNPVIFFENVPFGFNYFLISIGSNISLSHLTFCALNAAIGGLTSHSFRHLL